MKKHSSPRIERPRAAFAFRPDHGLRDTGVAVILDTIHRLDVLLH
jgi:hypothetical protein